MVNRLEVKTRTIVLGVDEPVYNIVFAVGSVFYPQAVFRKNGKSG